MKTLTCTLILLATPLIALAQEATVDPVKVLAPYVDEFTYGMGVVDLQNVGLDALLDRFGKVGMPKDEVAKLKRIAGDMRIEVIRAGGRHVCFALNLDDGEPNNALLVIPVGKAGNAEAIASVLGKVDMQAKIKGDTVLGGKAKVLEQAVARKPAANADLAKALAAVGQLPNRVALTIPMAFRKSLEELHPNLPKELGGGPITLLTRGLRWGAVGADLSAENLSLKAVVQAEGAEAATDVGRLADQLLALLRKEALGSSPDFAKGLQAIRPEVKGAQLQLAMDTKALDAAVLPMLARVREAASRAQSTNNLKQLAIAMHNYYDAKKTLPAQASYDKQKKPLLSWRVHLLPYLDHDALYKQFKLDEPWDSPVNKPLIDKIPFVFRSPIIVNAEPGKTTYLVPTGKELIFNGPKKTKFAEITDGTANTIFLVEAADSRAVWWTQPEDYKVDKQNPKAGLGNPGAPGFLAAFADGSVRFISQAVGNETLWFYFTPSGGEVIQDN